jgi:hypothetical protein
MTEERGLTTAPKGNLLLTQEEALKKATNAVDLWATIVEEGHDDRF